MVVTYYIKPSQTGTDRYNATLMPLLLLVAETIRRKLFSMATLNFDII